MNRQGSSENSVPEAYDFEFEEENAASEDDTEPAKRQKLEGAKRGSHTRFSEQQTEYLNKIFQETKFPSRDYRLLLAERLQCPESKIANWFTQRRFASKKRMKKVVGGVSGSTGLQGRRKAQGDSAVPFGTGIEAKIVSAIETGDRHSLSALLHLGKPEVKDFVSMPLDEEGHTAMHWAAVTGQLAIMKLLVENGFNPEALNKHGESALHRMVQFDHCYRYRNFLDILAIVGYSSVGLISNSGHTALHDLAYCLVDEIFHPAANYYIDVLTKLARKGMVDLKLNHQDPDGDTVIGIVAESTNIDFARKLLEAGADPTLANAKGELPISWAKKPMKQLLMSYMDAGKRPAGSEAPDTADQPARKQKSANGSQSPSISDHHDPPEFHAQDSPDEGGAKLDKPVQVAIASNSNATQSASSALQQRHITQTQPQTQKIRTPSKTSAATSSSLPPAHDPNFVLTELPTIKTIPQTGLPTTSYGLSILEAVRKMETQMHLQTMSKFESGSEVDILKQQLGQASERIADLERQLQLAKEYLAYERGHAQVLEQSLKELRGRK